MLILLFLGAGLQLALGLAQFNPIIVVVTIGSWAVGLVVRSRRQITEQLAARGRELEAERELFAAEAVRYERGRIARELHDIVAHCVSVMVIQASAGGGSPRRTRPWRPRRSTLSARPHGRPRRR